MTPAVQCSSAAAVQKRPRALRDAKPAGRSRTPAALLAFAVVVVVVPRALRAEGPGRARVVVLQILKKHGERVSVTRTA